MTAPSAPYAARPHGWLATGSAVAGLAGFVALDLFVGLGGAGVGRTISAYIYTPGAWLFQSVIVLLIIGSLALMVGLHRSGLSRPRSVGMVLFGLSVIGLAAIVIFPKTDWSQGDSLSGQLHRLGSLIAFLCPPIATVLLTRRPETGRHPLAARAARWLSAGTLLSLGALTMSAIVVMSQGGRWFRAFPLGTTERVLVTVELLTMIMLGLWVATQRHRTDLSVEPAAQLSGDLRR